MKIAISSINKNIKGDVSNIFGRCPYFVIIKIKGNKAEETEIIKNKSIDQNSSAGIATAQLLVENNINIVITGNIGPKALEVLKQFDIEVYSYSGTIKNALQDFIDKKLKKVS